MIVDFKCTVWERTEISPEIEKEVRELLLSGKIKSSNDLHELFEDDVATDTIYDTIETMSVEDNDGNATIEAFEDPKKESFFNNSEL